MKKNMFSKSLVLGVVVLFSCMSIFSSVGKNIESSSTDQKRLEIFEKTKSGCIEVYDVYAYFAYYPGGEEGLYGFDLDDPGNFTFISPFGGNYLISACFVPPCYIYFPLYDTGLMFALNVLTLDIFSVGGGGSGLNAIDYDDESGCLYGADSYGLYQINLTSGEQTLIGGWDFVYLMIAIAIDNGICYGLDIITDAIYTIDLETADLTLLGYTGLSLNYAQDMAFDKDNDTLYLAAYTTTSGGQLYIVNITNGECTLVGNFPGGAEVSALAIIYGNIPPYVPCDPHPEDGECNVPLNTTISWKGGDYNPEDIVAYDVYFGLNPDPPLVIYHQTGTCYDPYGPNNLIPYRKYYWQIVAWDNHGLCTPGPIWNFTTTYGPNPPNAPIIKGPTNGKVGIEYTYTFNSTDVDGDDLVYMVDWGDDSPIEYVGPSPQGVEVNATHTWYKKGTYFIKAKAKDGYGLESQLGLLEVKMPRNKLIINSLFLKFLEQIPMLERLPGLR